MSVRTTTKLPPLMVFDVESLGLHGEGYAVGWVVVQNGEIVEQECFWCPPEEAHSGARSAEDRKQDLEWAWANVLPRLEAHGGQTDDSPDYIRERFWRRWADHKTASGVLAADVCWPVETNFLSAAVQDVAPERYWNGPYPLIDIATLRALRQASRTEDIHDPPHTAETRSFGRYVCIAGGRDQAAVAHVLNFTPVTAGPGRAIFPARSGDGL